MWILSSFWSKKKSCFKSSPHGLITKENQLRISDFFLGYPLGWLMPTSSLNATRIAVVAQALHTSQIDDHRCIQKFPIDLALADNICQSSENQKLFLNIFC